MQNIHPIAARDNIADALVATIRAMIVDGRLPAGARINEVHLAGALGVSRTPLREALARLAHEGALINRPRIGYSVRPLTLGEFEQIYAIRALLDPEALRLAGLPTPEQLKRLRTLNEKITRARGTEAIIALDDQWHRELVAGCANAALLELIEQFSRRTRRYEIALMSARRNALGAAIDHNAIMAELERRSLAGACKALRNNLEKGREPIVAWLRERDNIKG
jgi:DNA-binding GntR family transcriptional regulator